MSTIVHSENVNSVPSGIGIRKFTVEEYRQLGSLGILTDDDRVELIQGVISPKMIHSPIHDGTLCLVEDLLREIVARPWIIRIQSAVTIGDSEPEPDVAIVMGSVRRYLSNHPQSSDIGLIVEIAESSLNRDRIKGEIYASAAIPNYWIVNLPDQHVEVYSVPTSSSDAARYSKCQIFTKGQLIPIEINSAIIGEIPVSSIFISQDENASSL